MTESTVLVTGGNAGIGKAIAVALAQQGRHIAIVSRNEAKGIAALDEIRLRGGSTAVDLVVGDLGTIAGAERLADEILARFPRLAALINNAGVWPTKPETNADGLELGFMVNHLAPFILCDRLFERLQANAPARIVNVNAGLYARGKLDLTLTPYGRDFGKFRTYASTKLCNTLFTVELARRIEGCGVTVNAIHPGVVRTNLGAAPGPVGWLLAQAKRFWKTPEQGARGPVWLATAPEAGQFNGRYFDQTKPIALAPIAEDRDLARRLWDLSEELVRGKPEPNYATKALL